MSTMNRPPQISAQVSNLCLSKPEAAFGGIDTHIAFLDSVAEAAQEFTSLGYAPTDGQYNGGYQITPTRALIASIDTARAVGQSARLEEKPLYSSVHQSWAGNNQYGIIMPREAGSIKTIERFGRNGEKDAVVFGDSRKKDGSLVNFGEYKLGNPGVQLTAEVFEAWGIPGDVPAAHFDIPDRMEAQGITHAVIDPYHLYRAHRKDAQKRIDPQMTMLVLGRAGVPINQVHLRAGNGDLGTAEDLVETKKDLAALIEGPRELAGSAMGALALQAHDIFLGQNVDNPNATFTYVNEVTEAALRAYHARTMGEDAPFNREIRAAYHAKMNINARRMFVDNEQRRALASI